MIQQVLLVQPSFLYLWIVSVIMKPVLVECICMFHGGLMIKRILDFHEGTILSSGEVWECLHTEQVWEYDTLMVVSKVQERIRKQVDMVLALRRMFTSTTVRWSVWLDVVKVFHNMTTTVKSIPMLLINLVYRYCALIIIGPMTSVSRPNICRTLSKSCSTIWVQQP